MANTNEMKMQKTAMVLTKDLRDRLETEAKRRTCSVSYLIREFCSKGLASTQREERTAA